MKSSKRRLVAILPLLGILTLLVGTCYWVGVRQENTLTPSQPTGVPARIPDQTGLPTAEVGLTVSPQPVPSPEQVVPSLALPQTAFTLTILYTGEVYGEVLPCPS